ncbi:snaclec rhodocetin subunit alpha-like isoform 2-T2 [Discoglossus pictus]
MSEEVTYADLKFHGPPQALDTLDPEKDDESDFQIYKEQVNLQGKYENIAQEMMYMKRNLCARNEDTDEGPPCLLCPIGWLQTGMTCYYRSRNQLSWEKSQQYCSKQNSRLWKIKSENEKEQVLALLKSGCDTGVYLWIGVKLTSRGVWEWIDNTTDNILKLHNQHSTETCGSIYYYNNAYGRDCKEENIFVCEKEAVKMS